MKRAVIVSSFAALCVFLWASPASAQKYDVEISLKQKKIINLSPQGLSIVFYLNLKNVSSNALYLMKYDYKVVVDQTEYLSLQTELDEPIRIAPNGTTSISLPLKITYEYLFQTVPGLKDKDRAACFLTGAMAFQDERRRERRIPLAVSGDFPIFHGLEVRPLLIEAKDVTVGGAELAFTAGLKNPNGFSIKISRISYALRFAGKAVAQGDAGQGASVANGGSKDFSIPLLLDFFENGKAVYDALIQPPVAVRISGDIEFSSPWGDFIYPFDAEAKVAVQKIA